MKTVPLFYMLLLATGLANASCPEKNDLIWGIEQSIKQNYDTALHHFEKIRQHYPHHPAGDLFMAIVLQTRMLDLETDLWKDQFYTHLNNALALADSLDASKHQSIPPAFYAGTALAYKSYQLGRENNFLPALQTGLKAQTLLQKCYEEDSTFCDPLLGIGSYLYWKSRITRHFNWLPFFSDDRQRGIQLVKKAYRCSIFSKMAALSNLAWIFIEEEQYNLAVNYASVGLVYHPDSRFFLWPLAEALLRQQQYASALKQFKRILQSIQTVSYNNHYNEIVLWLKCAQCYKALGKNEKAIEACNKVLAIQPAKEVKKRAKDEKEKAKTLLQSLQ